MMSGIEKVERTCKHNKRREGACGRTLYDDESCIFHSKDIEGKKNDFEDEFWKEFERQKEKEEKYDFTGFVFPGYISLTRKEFEKDVSFRAAKFSDKVDFGGAQFSGDADFSEAQFSGKAVFLYSKFSGQELRGLFDALRIRGLQIIFKGKYKIKDFKFHLSEPIAEEYPVLDRMSKDAWYLDDFKDNHLFIYALWNVMAKCGQSICRWAMWSLFFALYFAFNFYLIDYAFPHAFSFNPAIQGKSIWSFIYYSVVTFTTLGFGDIIPTLAWVQRWVMVEVIMGYVMLGGLISILANKLARRS